MAAKAMRKLRVGLIFAALVTIVAAPPAAVAQEGRGPTQRAAAHHDASPPLRDIAPAPAALRQRIVPLRPLPRPASSGAQSAGIQRSAATPAAPPPVLNFDGIGEGFSGPQGSFSVA